MPLPLSDRSSRPLTAALLAAVLLAGWPAFGQAPAQAPEAAQAERLPRASTTQHELALGDRTLAFNATAGALTLDDGRGREEADIAFVAYTLEGADPSTRPVTFAVNGGPGAASAYLQLGALGPWILPMAGERIVPSQDVTLVPNPDTWLDFTDLVFVDPVGTGFSRLVEPDDALRKRFLSIDGDVEALADFILGWLTENGRIAAPKYFVGESYGGFRGPLVAEKLQTDRGVGLDGLILLSPVLDFGWWQQPDHGPLPMASLLPSLAAARMEAAGTFAAGALAEAEGYAAEDYVADLLRGVNDPEAVGRLVDRVTALTGLDREVVARADGRIDSIDFAREALRDEGLRTSLYDATVTTEARGRMRRGQDPVLDAMTAPLTSAMLAHYRETLGWLPDRRYMLLNGDLSRAWDWVGGRGQPEVVGAITQLLELDPELRLLVAHGYTDLVTPYFGTTLILRQIRGEDRVMQENYRGGHMFYTRPDSRRAFREDARALYAGGAG